MRRLALPALAALVILVVGCGGKSSAAKEVSGPVASWGDKGVVALHNFEASRILEYSQGRVIAFGLYHDRYAAVVRLRPDGSLDPSFGKRGIVRFPYSLQLSWLTGALLPNGDITLAGATDFGVIGGNDTRLVVTVVDSHGGIVRSFGDNGYYSATRSSCLRSPSGIVAWGESIVVSAARFCHTFNSPGSVVAIRLGLDGKPDRSFGRNGRVLVTTVPGGTYPETPMLVLPRGRLLIATPASSIGRIEIVCLFANGTRDRSFGRAGVATAPVAADSWRVHRYDLFRAKSGGLSFTGSNHAGSFLVRFNSNGSPDLFWGKEGPHRPAKALSDLETNVERFGGAFGRSTDPGAQFAQLPDREFVVAGAVLTRLKPSGVVDPLYPGQPLFGSGRFRVDDLLVSADGTVLVMLLNYKSSSGKWTTYLARYRQGKTT